MNRHWSFLLPTTLLAFFIPVVINAACTDNHTDGYGIRRNAHPTVASDDPHNNIYSAAQELYDGLYADCDANTATLAFAPYKLTVVKSGNGGGTLTSAPKGIDCGSDCTETYTNATLVTLTAKHDATSDFGGWSGDCVGTKTSAKVHVTGDTTCTATLRLKSYKFKVKLSGKGAGKVSSDRAGIECGDGSNLCATKYEYTTTIVLTATPLPDDKHSSFITWTGCGSCTTSRTCVITVQKATTCKATFNAFNLKTKIKGSGQLASEPSGINCGTDCAEKYAPDVQVTLTAEPSNGYDLAAWSLKECPGTGTCPVTMNKAKAVTATFRQTETLVAPKVVVSYDPTLKDPVTDLADCIESVFACLNKQIALTDCFAAEVYVCAGRVPDDGCCMQACGDQLTQELQSGSSEHEAFLKVFVYDGSCMPNL